MLFLGHWAKHMNFLLPKGQNAEISQEGASMISSGCWSVFSSSKKNKSLRDGITAIIGQILKVILGNLPKSAKHVRPRAKI